MFYYSLIYSFFTYGIHVWGLTYPTYLTPITILQKGIVRIISFSEPVTQSEPILKSINFNLLKFCDIIQFEILPFVYQWLYKMIRLSCFSDNFKQISSVHSYAKSRSVCYFSPNYSFALYKRWPCSTYILNRVN